MKRVLFVFICLLLIGALVACNTTDAGHLSASTTLLNTVSYAADWSNASFSDEAYFAKLSDFSSRLYALCAEQEDGNYAFSPLSVYMAMAMLHSVGDEAVKGEVETLLGMTSADIAKTGDLFLSLLRNTSYNDDGVVNTKLDVTNSIWMDAQLTARQGALDRLANDLYCRAYRTTFRQNNAQANKDIREFIKQMTAGLIDKDFDLDADTLFALINTLYFKDVWSDNGMDLKTEMRDFKGVDATEITEFLIGKYTYGVTQSTDVCTYYYAATLGQYKLKLLLPNAGHTLAEAMSAENLKAVNATKGYYAEDEKVHHYTRCVFPSFNVESDTPLKDILERNHYLTQALTAYTSDLTDQELMVSEIKHTTVLNVDKTGIEGAAVTIIADKNTSVGPIETQYHDFVLDSPFGFLLTDRNGVVLFAGQITNP